MSSSVVVSDQLNFTCRQNEARILTFTLTNTATGAPVDLTGVVLEFDGEENDGTNLVKILTTDVSNPMGSVVVSAPTTGVVVVSLTPAATTALYAGRGGFTYWALWMNAGLSNATSVLDGQLVVKRVAQP